MKIVINRCFGGFFLSTLAFDELLGRKGVEFEKVKNSITFTQHDFNYWHKGRVGEEGGYISMITMTADRADVDLVAVVEALGEKSWGNFSELKVVEIPDDVKWHIEEYDGLEHVAEDHRTWYGDE